MTEPDQPSIPGAVLLLLTPDALRQVPSHAKWHPVIMFGKRLVVMFEETYPSKRKAKEFAGDVVEKLRGVGLA